MPIQFSISTIGQVPGGYFLESLGKHGIWFIVHFCDGSSFPVFIRSHKYLLIAYHVESNSKHIWTAVTVFFLCDKPVCFFKSGTDDFETLIPKSIFLCSHSSFFFFWWNSGYWMESLFLSWWCHVHAIVTSFVTVIGKGSSEIILYRWGLTLCFGKVKMRVESRRACCYEKICTSF